jgi:S-adenosylhomocysteine hydrolase
MQSNHDQIINDALWKFHKDEEINIIPESLPIVKDFCKAKKMDSNLFAGLEVLFIQHHLGPFIPRIQEMVNYGLELSRCWFVDIPYSTNDQILDKLKKMGCPENQMAIPFNDPIAHYSRRQIDRIEWILSRLAKKNNRRILIIDDGGYFVRTLNHHKNQNKKLLSQLKERHMNLVEQTTRGQNYLESKEGKQVLDDLRIPAVSIARAHTKYDLESPFIGAAVIKVAKRRLEEIHRLGNELGRVLVFGYGAVGKETVRELLNFDLDEPVEVYDERISSEKIDKEINSQRVNALACFPEKGFYDTVFGCTGDHSIDRIEELGILSEGAVLISGSSAAVEFNREEFIHHAYEHDKDNFFILDAEKTRQEGIHAPIHMQLNGKKFSFLNAGFPINFDGNLECVPYLIIQLTHGMLVAAAKESLECKEVGLHRLNDADDNWFNENGLKYINSYVKM